MIEEIKTRRLESMVGSNLCLNLCYKNLCKQRNIPFPHRRDVAITQNYILTLTIRNKAKFELPVALHQRKQALDHSIICNLGLNNYIRIDFS
jgi:hypothetical protein